MYQLVGNHRLCVCVCVYIYIYIYTKKSYEMEPHQEGENEEDLKLPGRKGLEDCWGGKGINRRRLG